MKHLIPLAILMATALAAQQSNPTPPPQGTRRDPGLFKGEKPGKQDENQRSVFGTVRNPGDDPVEGAIVQLKDTKTLKVRSFITQGDGNFRFHGLSTNSDYELLARYRQLESDRKTLSVYDSRKQAIINLKVENKKDKPKDEEEK